MNFIVKKLPLEGVLQINIPQHIDNRGSFMESYSEKIVKTLGSNIKWVQENESISKKYVFRGLHFQKGNYAQSKLIRLSNGKIIDVMLDLRKSSKTFLKYISINLKKSNIILFIPKGIAHGFISLSNNTIINYKCDSIYNPNYESGVNPFKSNLKIDFGVDKNKLIVSKKDLSLPSLDNCYIF